MLEQQTGVRGYGIGGDRSFLAPYTTGQATEASAAARLKQLLDGRQPMTRDLASIQQAVGRWRSSYAAPLIAAAAHGPLNGTEIPLLNGSEQAFKQLSKLFTAQNTHLAERAPMTAPASAGPTINNWTFTTIPVIVLIAAILLALMLCARRCEPLNRLGSSARQVVDGDFDQHIAGRGPADLRAVATDVEAMRSSLMAAVAMPPAQEFAASQAAT